MFVRLPNVPNVEHNLPVGSRQSFLGTLEALGAVPKTNLTRSPKIHQLMHKMQSSHFKISGLLQLNFLGSKTTQPLETYCRSGQTKPFGNHQDLPPTRGVGYLSRFQGRPLPYTYTGTIQEIPEISHPRSGIPVQGPAFRFVHSTLGVHRDSKGGETDGHTQGFKNPPVPRRLVGESQIPPGLSRTYTGTSK